MDIIHDDVNQGGPITVELPDTSNSREAKIRGTLTKRSRIIEVGASHAPIVPKSNGWNTTIVDHASREELIKKYANETNLSNKVEEVDFIWQDGDISDIFPKELHNSYDAIIASHVGEHIPDFIRFLQAADRLLQNG